MYVHMLITKNGMKTSAPSIFSIDFFVAFSALPKFFCSWQLLCNFESEVLMKDANKHTYLYNKGVVAMSDSLLN